MAITGQTGPPVAPAATRKLVDLPGPWGWPLLGNALQMDRHRMHAELEAWAARYGEAYTFRLMSTQIVVVSNPEVVAGVLRERPDTFRRSTRLERISREFGFLGLFSASGETWKRQRPKGASAAIFFTASTSSPSRSPHCESAETMWC